MLVLSLYQLPPSLPQPVKFQGWKVHTYVPADSIFDDPVTNLLSTLCNLTEILSSAHAKGGKSRNGFKLGTFTSRVPSDGAASKAVKDSRAETGLPVAYLILPLHMAAKDSRAETGLPVAYLILPLHMAVKDSRAETGLPVAYLILPLHMAAKELRAETGLPVAYLILPLHMAAKELRAETQYNLKQNDVEAQSARAESTHKGLNVPLVEFMYLVFTRHARWEL